MAEKIVLVKVLQAHNGSPDGINVNRYEADLVYAMPESLASVFIGQKWGKKATAVEKRTLSTPVKIG